MNFDGGFLATCLTVIGSIASGLVGGSLDVIRELLSGMTQAQATLVVGLTVGLVSQAGVWGRWYIERRKKGKATHDDNSPEHG
jgi:uncharacterized membrane protein YuzA (DUF378 family)